MKNLAFHWKILIGMILGVIIGGIAAKSQLGTVIISGWIKPIGQVFINLLKLVAVPLVITSLSKGISDLKNLTALSRIGGRTIFWFGVTTVFAVILGLILVNVFEPGTHVNPEALTELSKDYTTTVSDKLATVQSEESKGPLSFFIDLVPQNIFLAVTDNGRMLQVIFFTVFFSICLLMLPSERQQPIKELWDIANDVMIKMVDVIMITAPYAVFALLATLIAETTDGAIFMALLYYSLVLLLGMIIILLSYVMLIRFYLGLPAMYFIKGILPAQLVAISTSSSMATLPVTMECVEDNLGVNNEITSFVCPVGATINMDATSLMQGLAAVFVCQVLGHDLTLSDQFIIILTASLASIGAAAAPSAGIVMLVIVLESVGFPSEKLPIALAMILAVDRPLDMCRTVVNITGDSCVSVIVAHSLGSLKLKANIESKVNFTE